MSLTCADFESRLYDEDARRALLAQAQAPADMAAHRRSCAACEREWSEAAADAAILPVAILAPMPVDLERRLRVAVTGHGATSLLDWSRGITWAAVGGAAVLLLPVEAAGLGHAALALCAASVAFSAGVASQTLRRALR